MCTVHVCECASMLYRFDLIELFCWRIPINSIFLLQNHNSEHETRIAPSLVCIGFAAVCMSMCMLNVHVSAKLVLLLFHLILLPPVSSSPSKRKNEKVERQRGVYRWIGICSPSYTHSVRSLTCNYNSISVFASSFHQPLPLYRWLSAVVVDGFFFSSSAIEADGKRFELATSDSEIYEIPFEDTFCAVHAFVLMVFQTSSQQREHKRRQMEYW